MSAEKKVLLLFLSLIILIILCVYIHLPNLMKEVNDFETEKVESSQLLKSKNSEEIIVNDVNIDEQKNENLEALQNDTQDSSILENREQELINNENSENLENEKNSTSLEETETNILNEVPEIPLITTDSKYIRTLDEKKIEELSKQTQELQIKISDYVKENPVSFTRGGFIPTNKSNETIEMVFEILQEFNNLKIEVAGHTDAIGASKLNQSISLKRAEAVSQKLISLGIDKDRIISRGYGEDIPFVKNSVNGYSKVNRRVEFNIVEE